MEVSKLTFKEDTIKKMDSGLTRKEKGKILEKRLKELDETGRLAFVKNRLQLATAVGYTDEEAPKRGAAWVSAIVKRGLVSETLRGFDRNNKPEYEYHYNGNKRAKHTPSNVKQEGGVKQEEQMATVPIATDNKTIKIEILKGDITIRVEFIDQDRALGLITTLLNKA